MTEAILIFFTFLCLTQVVTHWSVFAKILKHKANVQHPEKSVSVIVAARNEVENLPALIDSIASQKHSNFELIIVNDRSTDGSKDVLTYYEAIFDWLVVIHIDTLPTGWTGKKHAIRKGMESSSKEVLLFTDADCIADSEDWISKMTLTPEDVTIGYAPYLRRKGFLNQFIQFETLMTGLQYLGFALIGKPYMSVGRNWAIKKTEYPLQFLEEIKSFEGGDDDLVLNHLSSNIRIAVSLDAQTVSKPKETWSTYFKQKRRHLSVGKHYHQKHQTLLAIYTLCHVVGWFMFLSLLITSFEPYIILIIFGLRSLSFYTIFTSVGRKLGTMPNIWALPLLDLCYSIYYPLVGISAWSAKKIEWS